MGTQDNGKVIPFSPRIREDIAEAAPAYGSLNDLALLRRRGLDMADSVAPSRPGERRYSVPDAVPADSLHNKLDAPQLSALFIDSLDDMICAKPAQAATDYCWPSQREASLEKVAVDIVDMLFGFVLDDPQVPRGVKESLLRAQMPMLQLAMREPTFFSDWQHPARKLLNDVAPMARHFHERGGDTQIFEQEFAAGLERVLDDLAPNGLAFAILNERLGAFTNNAPVETSSSDGMAWERAEAVAREFLERPLPHLARDFLAGYWIDVLQRTALMHPADSPQWQDTVAVVEDLAWSLAPKNDQDDRLQLIGLIPALLARLNRGLDLIDVARGDRRPFFDALIEVHAMVLRAELTPPPPPPKHETAIEQVCRLQRGDWVEFQLADSNVSRERLTWISPQRGILVFSNHQGQRAIQIAPEALADLVREHKAMLIFDQPDVVTDKNSA
ncbi:MAG: hypothetical protein QG619_1325 [Pseudomonadota bacterium]|nr:hypothetical protein [Pseudomonadota bacterium]